MPQARGQGERGRQQLRQFGIALALALAAVALACFAVPAGIYAGNRAEFDEAWTTLLAPFAPNALLVALGFALVLAVLPARAFRAVLALVAMAVLLAWAQATLLVWDYGVLDGHRIDWSQDRWRGWVDAGAWALALLAAWHWRERIAPALLRIAVVVCTLQVALAAGALFRARGSAPPPVVAAPDAVLVELAAFSSGRNVLHILADGYQSDIFADLLAEDDGRLARELEGFVFFEDHLGAFPYTHMSVPAMMGGRVYNNAQPQGPFLDEALGRGSIFAAARADGFDVQIGIPSGGLSALYGHAGVARQLRIPNQARAREWRTSRQEALLLGDLALFRLAPHFLKRRIYDDQRWFLQPRYGRSPVPGRSFLAHNLFLRRLAAAMTVGDARPKYKLLHLMLSHRPMVARPDCSYAGRTLDPDRANVRNQGRCSLRSIQVVLARMRALGIYDDATIVISGDHGTFIAPNGLGRGTPAHAAADAVGIGANFIGQARPLLLVKAPGATGPLRRSAAPTWIVDTPATIADAARIPGAFPGTSALRLVPDASRERTFQTYLYLGIDTAPDAYLGELREFVVRGPGNDVASWTRGRTFVPPRSAASGSR